MVGARPGTGGIDRGRADAALIWGEETAGRLDAFEVEALSPAEVLDLESSAILGVGAAAPEALPRGEGAGLAGATGSVGKAAWKRRLAPSHRDAVRSFFQPASEHR